MAEVNETIEVEVPVSTAYNQWTQFEEFPKFMDNVESVKQVDDTHLHWVAQVAGQRQEWDAEITYQDVDKQITWKAIDGKDNTGAVQFEPLNENRTKMVVRITWEAETALEKVGDVVGADERGVKADLKKFKELVESRGAETGSWRGEVREGDVVAPDKS